MKGDEGLDLFEEKKPPSPLEDKIEEELLNNRILVLHGELNEELCNKICKRLLYLQQQGKEEITVVLNSVGGEVYHGLLIYNTLEDLKRSGIKVIMEARGVCASMAVVILQGASVRKASKYTRFLLHEVSSWAYGKASEVKEESEELEKVNSMLDEIIALRSKLTLRQLKKKTKKRNWWLSAEEALKYELIDEVVKPVFEKKGGK